MDKQQGRFELRPCCLLFGYNFLNLISEVKQGTTVKANYKWSATGAKLGVRDGAGTNGYDYMGSIVYKKNGTTTDVDVINFSAGVIRKQSGSYMVNYFINDHLGSTRVIVDGSGAVKEKNDYYPFGARHKRSDYIASDNRYKYNGKEEQTTGDVGFLDYGARMYDARIGRWHSVDPHAVDYYSHSPYFHALNNPINAIDPNGKDGYLVIWLTADGNIGHAGFAIDNYKREKIFDEEGNAVLDKEGNATYKMVKDGTVTYMDLWPGHEGGVGMRNAGQDVEAYYGNTITTVEKLLNADVTGSEGYAPQGAIKISTNYQADMKTMRSMTDFMKTNIYNGRTRNCSDFAKLGVEMSLGRRINAQETIMFQKSTIPNALYRATAEQKNTTVLKDPGPKVNTSFISGAK